MPSRRRFRFTVPVSPSQGARDYVTKPVDVDMLLEKIAAVA
jgi:DNA-binding response OmpR family regulator